jgi:hypothetical protein
MDTRAVERIGLLSGSIYDALSRGDHPEVIFRDGEKSEFPTLNTPTLRPQILKGLRAGMGQGRAKKYLVGLTP